MEETESTARGRSTGNGGKQAADQTLLMSSKPLHRFVQREPRSLGIVIMIFGCAEVLIGFVLAQEIEVRTSCVIYIPFWQGALFLVCGNLSIYTEIHPSKKMVTVCLSMYVVSLLGLVISVIYRIHLLISYEFQSSGRYSYYDNKEMFKMLQCIEGMLVTSSLCVSVLLIFLSTIARLALKSTRTQMILQHIPPPLPQSDATSH